MGEGQSRKCWSTCSGWGLVMSVVLLVLGHCFWQAGVGSRASELPSILGRFPHGSHRSNHLDRSLFA